MLKKNKYLILVPLIIIINFFVFLIIISEYNIYKIKPTVSEIKLITSHYGNICIKNESDIIHINNLIIDDIKSELNLHFPIDIKHNILSKKGLCYDRSLILQKILIANNIPLRPIYLYYFKDGSSPNYLDIFSKNLNSHNIFEFNYNGKWFIMRTNTKMSKLQTLDEYLIDNGGLLPPNTKYIKYLNNRNSKFISPNWIPDIYYYFKF